MLTLPEKILFTLALIATAYFTYRAIRRLVRIIGAGQGSPDWSQVPGRIWGAFWKALTLRPVWRLRFFPSLFHALVAWGFAYYMLVNLGDVLQAYIPGFTFMGTGTLGNWYRLGADVLSVGVLVGMSALLIRRLIFRPRTLGTREDIFLNEKARHGLTKDSTIVGLFILFHVGFRFLGETFHLALTGHADPWQPFAGAVAPSGPG